MEKTKWTKPELVVLVRSKPEEAVLFACKIRGAGQLSFDGICGIQKNHECKHDASS